MVKKAEDLLAHNNGETRGQESIVPAGRHDLSGDVRVAITEGVLRKGPFGDEFCVVVAMPTSEQLGGDGADNEFFTRDDFGSSVPPLSVDLLCDGEGLLKRSDLGHTPPNLSILEEPFEVGEWVIESDNEDYERAFTNALFAFRFLAGRGDKDSIPYPPDPEEIKDSKTSLKLF